MSRLWPDESTRPAGIGPPDSNDWFSASDFASWSTQVDPKLKYELSATSPESGLSNLAFGATVEHFTGAVSYARRSSKY